MIHANIETTRRRIEVACAKSGRNPSEIVLLAVSKTFPAGIISQAIDVGVWDLGENYVQELLEKKEKLCDRNVRWHFIGHLQSNKVKLIAGWIHLIHSLDNAAIAAEIDKWAFRSGRVIDVLVEVNTTGERTKFGVSPGATIDFVKDLSGFRNIRVSGLMTVGPFLPDPEGSRPMFRALRLLKDEIASLGLQNVTMNHLSMGMTGDFEVAISEGATIVRIGTAIFGKRTRKA